jgi:hypothetical protein
MSLYILAKFTLFYVKRARKITYNFGARKMLGVAVAFGVIWNKNLTNLVPVLRKATKYLSAESGYVSEGEVEIDRKSENQIQEK